MSYCLPLQKSELADPNSFYIQGEKQEYPNLDLIFSTCYINQVIRKKNGAKEQKEKESDLGSF